MARIQLLSSRIRISSIREVENLHLLPYADIFVNASVPTCISDPQPLASKAVAKPQRQRHAPSPLQLPSLIGGFLCCIAPVVSPLRCTINCIRESCQHRSNPRHVSALAAISPDAWDRPPVKSISPCFCVSVSTPGCSIIYGRSRQPAGRYPQANAMCASQSDGARSSLPPPHTRAFAADHRAQLHA